VRTPEPLLLLRVTEEVGAVEEHLGTVVVGQTVDAAQSVALEREDAVGPAARPVGRRIAGQVLVEAVDVAVADQFGQPVGDRHEKVGVAPFGATAGDHPLIQRLDVE
jgi:hypothetical protein